MLRDLLEQRVAARPDQPQFTYLGAKGRVEASLTVRELWQEAHVVGRALQERGLAVGDRVLLAHPPGIAFIPALFGCMFAGLVPVPVALPDPTRIDRDMPRFRRIAQECGARVALTTTAYTRYVTLRGVVGSLGRLVGQKPEAWPELEWVATDALTARSKGPVELLRPVPYDPTRLAFLQFTSGSTSHPKGVMVPYAAVMANVEIMARETGVNDASVLLSWVPFFHDMALVGGLLHGLYTGAHVIAMSPLVFLEDPMAWLEAIQRHGATHTCAPNFAFELVMRRATPERLAKLDLSCLRVVLQGGEVARPRTFRAFVDRFGPRGFRPEVVDDCYGLAEHVLYVSGHTPGEPRLRAFVGGSAAPGRVPRVVAPGTPGSVELFSCGKPPKEVHVAMVDAETRRPVAPGAVGEVWVASPCVARGYWGRADAENDATFRARTEPDDGRTWLRTGDLGFVDGDELFLCGRVKDLVIVAGKNLAPQDLELAAQESHPAIRPGCVAAFSTDGDDGERLVIVAEVRDERASPATLEGEVAPAIAARIAEQFGAPCRHVVLVRRRGVPKTSSGKVRRRPCRDAFLDGSLLRGALLHVELPDRSIAPAAADSDGPLPRDADGRVDAETLERWLRGWAARRLGIDPASLDPERPLAGYGLDSVVAVELVHALEERLERRLDGALAWTHPTLRGLAEHLADGDESAAGERLDLHPVDVRDPLPLSFTERGLFALVRRAERQDPYNLFFPLRSTGPIDEEALAAALATLVDRHESLRTGFFLDGDTPRRRVYARAALELRVDDLSALAAPERAAAVAAACKETLHHRFDLARPPLVAMRLLRVSPAERVLLVSISHLVTDAWGMAVLGRELARLYRAVTTGEAPPAALPPEATAAAYAVASDTVFRSRLEAGASAWPPYPAAHYRFPYDRPMPAKPRIEGQRHVVVVDAALRGRVQESVQRRGFPLSAACVVAFQAALHRLGSVAKPEDTVDEVLFTVVQGNRRLAPLREVIGYFAFGELFHGDAQGGPSWEALLERARRFVLEERLGEQPRLFLTQPPQLRIVLNFHNFKEEEADAAPLFVLAPDLDARTDLWDTHDVLFQVFPGPFGLVGDVRYRDEVIDAGTIVRLGALWAAALEEIAADPDAAVSVRAP